MIKTISHTTVRQHRPRRSTKFSLPTSDLWVSHKSDNRIYFRGTESRPYIYIAEEAKTSAYVSEAFEVVSREALVSAAARFDLPIEPIDAPGGGEKVTLLDPDENIVELVFGIEEVSPPTPAS